MVNLPTNPIHYTVLCVHCTAMSSILAHNTAICVRVVFYRPIMQQHEWRIVKGMLQVLTYTYVLYHAGSAFRLHKSAYILFIRIRNTGFYNYKYIRTQRSVFSQIESLIPSKEQGRFRFDFFPHQSNSWFDHFWV